MLQLSDTLTKQDFLDKSNQDPVFVIKALIDLNPVHHFDW